MMWWFVVDVKGVFSKGVDTRVCAFALVFFAPASLLACG